MYGDKFHKALLDAGWTWDSEAYEKGFAYAPGEGEALILSPHIYGNKSRYNRWDLLIKVLNSDSGEHYSSRVCSYKCFIDAAKAVLGNT